MPEQKTRLIGILVLALAGIVAQHPVVKNYLHHWKPGLKFAAKAALAARKQGKFEALHHGLLAARGQHSESSVLTIARQVGLDVERLKQDMEDPAIEDALKRTRALAKELYITGTPALVLGDEVIAGVPAIPTLERLIAKARES
ncbi:DsbA family protein [Mesorhizobium sp. WSM2239]|uniref:DsbA family protein n=2 Tax=unclassified Mesorhizobium TaxID=325217 RepID=A0AAU8D6Q2_9HYPH